VTSRGDADRLSHIADAIDRISSYAAELSGTPGPPTGVVGDALNDAVLYNLAVIGEAVKALSPAVRDRDADDLWRKFAGLRDILIHSYFRVDQATIDDIVTRHVPQLADLVREQRELTTDD
jgi:uncharacterized protein with HEPN domain